MKKKQSIIVLQARTSSSRLPAKVLLPINNTPIVVLAARRAMNTGRDLIVVTSTDPSDNYLVNLLQQEKIRVERGSLENVLDRVVGALHDFDEECLVFRLTADNVFPDGDLLDQIEKEYLDKNLNYLVCNGEESGAPYGVSVELTKLSLLREAHRSTEDNYDQEHVTPFIKRKHGVTHFLLTKNHEYIGLRSTIDNFDDYINILQVFEKVEDPETTKLQTLLNILNQTQDKTTQQDNCLEKLVLGTAQLGMNYGINNKNGKPNEQEAQAIISRALAHGLTSFDTARSYDDSETILGRANYKDCHHEHISIITKLAQLPHSVDESKADDILSLVDSSVLGSMKNLRLKTLDTLLLHRADHLHIWDGVVWGRLKELREAGFIEKLGVSVQTPEEFKLSIADEQVSHIQFPYNILDHRWDESIHLLQKMRKKRDVIIHVRSIFLQGLLLSESPELWLRAHVSNPDKILSWLKDMLEITKRDSISELCLAYVRSLVWIDGIVIGMETEEQLEDNIAAFSKPLLSDDLLSHIRKTRPKLDERNLNPHLWRQN